MSSKLRLRFHLTLHTLEETKKIQNPIQCTYILSFAFFFVFSAFMSIQALQSSLNIEEGLGTKSLACVYAASLISCIVAPLGIKVIGGKLCTIIAILGHTLYVGSNFYPRFFTLIPSSVLLGLVTGPLWICQSLYLTSCAATTSQKHEKKILNTLNRLNGVFYSIHSVAFAVGSIVSSVIFRNNIYLNKSNITFQCGVLDCDKKVPSNSTTIDSDIFKPSQATIFQLISVYLAFDVIGLLLTIFFLPPLPKSKWIQNKTVGKSLYSMFSALSDMKLVLLLPYIVATGLLPFFLYADFAKAYVACPFGIGMVGYVMASFCLSITIFMKILPKVAKCVHGNILVAMGTVIYFLYMGLWLIWNPTKEHLPFVFLVAVLAGFSESVYKIDIFAKIPLLFPEKKETAFTNLQFWRGVVWTAYFATSSYLCVFTKVVFCLSLLAISICLYGVLQFKWRRELETQRSKDQKEKVDVTLDDEKSFLETDKEPFENLETSNLS